MKSSVETPNTPIEHHLYYDKWIEVRTLIHTRFPYGALNRPDVTERLGLSEYEIEKNLITLRGYEQALDKVKTNIARVNDITQPLQGGNAQIFTDYAIGYLKQKYPSLAAEALYFNMGYQVLVIGRKSNSSRLKPSKWRDALICDLWADRCYPATQLEQQRASKIIPFYEHVVLEGEPSCLRINSTTHYLSGETQIFVGARSASYDESLRQWVIEDRRRLALPEPEKPSSSSTVIENFGAAEVIPLLEKISKMDLTWSYVNSQKTAFCRCSNQAQATRLSDTLKATKAMVVTTVTLKVKDEEVFGVKCEHFELSKIKTLVEATQVTMEEWVKNSNIQIFSH